jgi:hypothetical protein
MTCLYIYLRRTSWSNDMCLYIFLRLTPADTSGPFVVKQLIPGVMPLLPVLFATARGACDACLSAPLGEGTTLSCRVTRVTTLHALRRRRRREVWAGAGRRPASGRRQRAGDNGRSRISKCDRDTARENHDGADNPLVLTLPPCFGRFQVHDKSLDQVKGMIIGQPGTPVTLTILRPSPEEVYQMQQVSPSQNNAF